MAKKTTEDVLVEVHGYCEVACNLVSDELGALDDNDLSGEEAYEVPVKNLRAIRKQLCKAVALLDKKIG